MEKLWYYYNLKIRDPSEKDIEYAIECIKNKFHYFLNREIEDYELALPPPKILEELINSEKDKIEESIKELTETLKMSKKLIAFA